MTVSNAFIIKISGKSKRSERTVELYTVS